MSREFTLDEPVSCFADVLRACLDDLLCSYAEDELSCQDKIYLAHVLLAWQRYQRVQNKLDRAKQKIAAQSLDSTAAQNSSIPAGFTSVEDLSSDHSTFCDFTDLMFSCANEVLPGTREAIQKKLQLMFDSFFCLDELEEFCPYLHMFSFANNRTIIKCSPRDIGDEILLNHADLFTKLPTWSLVLDFSDHPIPFTDGDKVTGVSIIRTPFGLGAETLKKQITRKKLNSKPKGDLIPLEFDGISLMLCVNNLSYYCIDCPIPIEPDMTVLDALHEGFFVDVNDKQTVEALKAKALEAGEQEPVISVDTEDGPVSLMCSTEMYNALKEMLKYICYVITHLSQIKNEQGDPTTLTNINLFNVLPQKSIAALGSRHLPIVTCTI